MSEKMDEGFAGLKHAESAIMTSSAPPLHAVAPLSVAASPSHEDGRKGSGAAQQLPREIIRTVSERGTRQPPPRVASPPNDHIAPSR